jgi:hypothetical protein
VAVETGRIFSKKIAVVCLWSRGACGSGRVAVIRMALDRGDGGGHFGANLVAWLWLGRWLGGSKDNTVLFVFFCCCVFGAVFVCVPVVGWQ